MSLSPLITDIDADWQVAERIPAHRDLFLSEGGERDWLPATVPGHVHTDLQKAGVTGDPFYRLQERGAAWIDEADWTYRTVFDVPAERLAARGATGKHYLDFGGLDTIARVYLNGTLIGAVENMLVEHRFDVTEVLREGANDLRVEFDSALRAGRDRAAAYLGDGSSDRGTQTYFNFAPRAFVRKAQYQFGWDWGPELVSCGIWKPVQLVTVPLAEIVDWRMDYRFLDAGTVEIDLQITVEKHTSDPLTVGAALYAPGDNTPDAPLPDAPGLYTVHLKIPRQAVHRWHPHGSGTVGRALGTRVPVSPQKRYLLNLRLWETGVPDDERVFVDHKGNTVGFRTVELVREPDADGGGEGFLFRINGADTFIKGANWIPDHSLPSLVTPARLRQRLTQARDAGFNMLRVWGGGLYESDDFYAICGELGILVWQDFCFACSMYPDDDAAFVENVRHEATLAVKRLRNRVALALWCGGNENVQLFQEKWSGNTQATTFYGAKLIHETLPAVLAEEDTATPYWANSPYSGTPDANSQDQNRGDAHCWAVWHSQGGSTGDWVHYAENDCRFSSEFGFASSCGIAAWKTCTTPEDRADPRSPVLQWHNKTRKDYETYFGYIEKHFPAIETLDDLVYYGQSNQAMALQFGIEHWRRRKGRCWGTLFWQLNDCWQTQSWAVIDSLGEPKAAYYACKRFYAPVLLSLFETNGTVEAHIVNDTAQEVRGRLSLSLMGVHDAIPAWRETVDVAVAQNATNADVDALVAAPLPETVAANRTSFYWQATLTAPDGETVLAQNILLLCEPKELAPRAADLSTTVAMIAPGTALVGVRSEAFAAFVWLRLDGLAGTLPTFSDNYFHLLPGETRMVEVGSLPPGMSVSEFVAALRVRHL